MHEHQPPSTTEDRSDISPLAERLARAIEQSPPALLPRIWAGSIDDYLAGQPYGHWVHAGQSQRHLADAVNTMLARAPLAPNDEIPTWGIFALEGFGRHEPTPDASIGQIVRSARTALSESRAFAAWSSLDRDSQEQPHRFAESYQGRFDHLTDWVTLQVEAAGYDQLLDERVPGHLRPFIDINVEALAHDMTASGEVLTIRDREEGGVWVFTKPAR